MNDALSMPVHQVLNITQRALYGTGFALVTQLASILYQSWLREDVDS